MNRLWSRFQPNLPALNLDTLSVNTRYSYSWFAMGPVSLALFQPKEGSTETVSGKLLKNLTNLH